MVFTQSKVQNYLLTFMSFQTYMSSLLWITEDISKNCTGPSFPFNYNEWGRLLSCKTNFNVWFI